MELKPPIGVEPRWSWEPRMKVKRLGELLDAICRYRTSGLDVPFDWLKEAAEYTECIADTKPKVSEVPSPRLR